MGIEGAALATTIANAFSAIYLLGALSFSKSILFRPGKGIIQTQVVNREEKY